MVAGVETSRNEVPARFRLEQNYPNPFSAGGGSPPDRWRAGASGGNPITRIRYTIGGKRGEAVGVTDAGPGGWGLGARKTSLVVYDVLGRQVATLVDEVKAPGSYEVSFDGNGLASGVYIYRMTAGAYTESRKMVLVR
jgi:hypothetical protein